MAILKHGRLSKGGGNMNWDERKRYYDKWYFTEHSSFVDGSDNVNYLNDHNEDGHRVVAKFIYDLCQPESILDCGCGNGHLEYDFYLLGMPIIKGFDICEYGVSVIPDIIKEAVFQHDITEGIPFSDKEFDLIILFDVLEHLHNYELLGRAVSEVCRVNKKNILIRTPMVSFAHTKPTREERLEEEGNLLIDLNNISHEARIELVGVHPLLCKPKPLHENIEHPLEHPREFWIKLFESFGFKEKRMPDEYYKFPNPLSFISFNAALFERIE